MYNDPVKVFNEKDSCKQLEATNATSGLANVLLFLLTEITIWITFRGNLTKLVSLCLLTLRNPLNETDGPSLMLFGQCGCCT